MRQLRSAVVIVCVLALGVVLPSAASAQNRIQVLRSRVSALGANVRDVTAADATTAKVEAGKGAYVVGVSDDGPAAKAGIKAGDVILEFDGQAVRSAAMLSRLVTETPAGRAVKVGVVRGGKRLDLTVSIEAGDGAFTFDIPNMPGFEGRQFSVRPPILAWPSPDEPQQSPPNVPRFSPPTPSPRFAPPLWRYDNGGQIGVSVQELTPQLREYFGVSSGVLVASVAAASAAARAGLKAGDVITMLDKIVVRSADDLRRLLQDRHAGDRATLNIMRDRKPMTLTVTLEEPRPRVRPI